MNVVGLGTPFTVSATPGMKFVPVNVIVNPGFPATSGVGTPTKLAITGDGLPTMNVAGADVTLPPGPVVRTTTDARCATASISPGMFAVSC